jgi:hypothetical protein
MENCRFLKNICAKQIATDDAARVKTMHNDEMVTTTMMNRTEILIINSSLPPKLFTPSSAERCLYSPNASANCSNELA